MITVECSRKKRCGWITDLEETSETNPSICPKCGGTIMIAGTNQEFADYEYNTEEVA